MREGLRAGVAAWRGLFVLHKDKLPAWPSGQVLALRSGSEGVRLESWRGLDPQVGRTLQVDRRATHARLFWEKMASQLMAQLSKFMSEPWAWEGAAQNSKPCAKTLIL
ncbi:unnamed protein product [Amoebophrya sp. A25]|nr:unnamed protein product [Amoebophrya sp. A25]|eukprot:GSA25T00001860001.1